MHDPAPHPGRAAGAQIFPPEEKIELINDTYWTVRAEPDEDEEAAGAGPGSLVHCYHYHVDAQNHVRSLPSVRSGVGQRARRLHVMRGSCVWCC